MSRFTIREYSDFGIEPQDQTRILFESDSLSDVKEYIKNYFTWEYYYNSVYFIDNELNKHGYVGRDLKINLGESLSDFCEIQENEEIEAVESKELEALEKLGNIDVYYNRNGLECCYSIKDTNEYDIIETSLKEQDEIKEENKHLIHSIVEKDKTLLHLNHELAQARSERVVMNDWNKAKKLIKKAFDCGYVRLNYGELVACNSANLPTPYPFTEEETKFLYNYFKGE